MARNRSGEVFRDRTVLKSEQGWQLISRGEEGLSTWVRQAEDEVTFKHTGPQDLLLEQYVPLLTQANQLGLGRPWIDKGVLYVPDWGESFRYRRLTVGWVDTYPDVIDYYNRLLGWYPDLCVEDVSLFNMVRNDQGIVSQPDMRTYIPRPYVLKQYPTETEWLFRVRELIEESWETFLDEYGDQVDLVQQQREEADETVPYIPTPGRRIIWP